MKVSGGTQRFYRRLKQPDDAAASSVLPRNYA